MLDITNGLFELGGGLLLFMNCWKLYKEKKVRGVSVGVTSFFTLWGYWNLYYYPSLGQMWSFLGGLLIVIANTCWVSQAIYYTRKEKCNV